MLLGEMEAKWWKEGEGQHRAWMPRWRRRSRTFSLRRTGVSSEVKTVEEKFEKKVVEKSEDAKNRIRTFFSKNYLLQHLDLEQAHTIVEAVEEVHFKEGDAIIHQGEPGEYFFLLEQGAADVWITKPGGTEPELAKQYSSGDTFGELALLYNAPRAATVKASTDCVLWALDRATFRAILMTTTHEKRNLYESFLKEVPLLKGEAEARSQGKAVMRYKRGDYFGELALLNDAPRAATVTAVTKCKLVSINRDQFKRLLGKLEDMLHRKKEEYEKANAAAARAAPAIPSSGAGPSVVAHSLS